MLPRWENGEIALNHEVFEKHWSFGGDYWFFSEKNFRWLSSQWIGQSLYRKDFLKKRFAGRARGPKFKKQLFKKVKNVRVLQCYARNTKSSTMHYKHKMCPVRPQFQRYATDVWPFSLSEARSVQMRAIFPTSCSTNCTIYPDSQGRRFFWYIII